MMEKMVIVKMARYIELVEQFSKNETDIFTEEEINSTRNNGTLTLLVGSGIGGTSPYNILIPGPGGLSSRLTNLTG